MKHRLSNSFALRSIVLASLHFAVVWLIGLYLISRYGFSHPPIQDVYEATLGAGVIYLGLPDTVGGWLFNSALYGIAGAAILNISHQPTGHHSSTPKNQDA